MRPVPGRGLTSASATHLTPYGEAKVAWQRGDGQLTLEVTVPVGATATVHVPGRDRAGRRSGTATTSGWWPTRCATSRCPPDATIRQVLDHEPTWAKVAEAAVGAGVVADDAELAARLAPLPRRSGEPGWSTPRPARGFVPGRDEFRARLADVLPS